MSRMSANVEDYDFKFIGVSRNVVVDGNKKMSSGFCF